MPTAEIQMYSTAQVAELLGVSRQLIQKRAQRRGIGTRVADVMVFTDVDIAALRVLHKRGRKPGWSRIHTAETV